MLDLIFDFVVVELKLLLSFKRAKKRRSS